MTPAVSRGIRRAQQKNFEAQLKAMGCDPVEIMVRIASNNVPCSVCRGEKRTYYRLKRDQHHPTCTQPGNDPDGICLECHNLGRRICMSCKAKGLEAIPPTLMASVTMKMLDKLVPDLRSVEVKGSVDLALTGMVERLLEGRSRAAQIMEMPRLQIEQNDGGIV